MLNRRNEIGYLRGRAGFSSRQFSSSLISIQTTPVNFSWASCEFSRMVYKKFLWLTHTRHAERILPKHNAILIYELIYLDSMESLFYIATMVDWKWLEVKIPC